MLSFHLVENDKITNLTVRHNASNSDLESTLFLCEYSIIGQIH